MSKYTITYTDYVPYLGHEITASTSVDPSFVYREGGDKAIMKIINELAVSVNETVAKRLADAGIVLDEFGRKASDEAPERWSKKTIEYMRKLIADEATESRKETE